MRKLIILFTLVMFFSCSKKGPSIAWENDVTFVEILENVGEGYIMLDFIRDG